MYTPPISSNIVHVFCRFPILALVVTAAFGAIYLPQYMNTETYCNQTYVSFTFDDGYDSIMLADSILAKYGYDGTAFITTDQIGIRGHLTQEQIKYLSLSGWEIGSHGKTHSDLTQIPIADAEYELKYSKESLDAFGLTVVTFASPNGKYDTNTLNLIKKYYSAHRTGEGIYNNIPISDPYKIKAFEVKQSTSVEELKQMVTYAKENKLWLVLIFHKIDDTSDYGYSLKKFEDIVKFVRESNYISEDILVRSCQTCQ